jgi:putative SbcD/Mre11-related phosphoesterase
VSRIDPLSFHDRAVFLPAESTLVLADIHLGRAAASDVQSDLSEHEETVGRFEALLARFDPDEVVVAGDLLHSFSSLPRGVTETLQTLERTAREVGAGMVVTPGNHDTMLSGLWDGPTETEYPVGDWVVCHGHDVPETDVEAYLVGHDHPTLEIEGQRHPCYLYGEGVYHGADVLMLPSFTRLAAGVAVSRMRAAEFQSPLVTDTDRLRPLVRDEGAAGGADGPGETLSFPPLGEFRRML